MLGIVKLNAFGWAWANDSFSYVFSPPVTSRNVGFLLCWDMYNCRPMRGEVVRVITDTSMSNRTNGFHALSSYPQWMKLGKMWFSFMERYPQLSCFEYSLTNARQLQILTKNHPKWFSMILIGSTISEEILTFTGFWFPLIKRYQSHDDDNNYDINNINKTKCTQHSKWLQIYVRNSWQFHLTLKSHWVRPPCWGAHLLKVCPHRRSNGLKRASLWVLTFLFTSNSSS